MVTDFNLLIGNALRYRYGISNKHASPLRVKITTHPVASWQITK